MAGILESLLKKSGRQSIINTAFDSEKKQVLTYFLNTGLLGGGMKDDAYKKMVITRVGALDLRTRALNKIGIDESQLKEIPPVFLHGYSFFEDGEANNYSEELNNGTYRGTLVKIAKDGSLVSSKYDGSWLFFTDEQMLIYSYTVDLAFGGDTEEIEEFFYKDITNLTITSGKYPICDRKKDGCLGSLGAGDLTTTLIPAQNFSIAVPQVAFRCSITGVPNAEQLLSAVRHKVREKKFST